MNNSSDNNDKSLTSLDLARLDELELNSDGEVKLESNYWTVFAYPREFILLGKKGEFKEFKKKEQLISFLSK